MWLISDSLPVLTISLQVKKGPAVTSRGQSMAGFHAVVLSILPPVYSSSPFHLTMFYSPSRRTQASPPPGSLPDCPDSKTLRLILLRV